MTDTMDEGEIKHIVEALLMAAGKPLTVDQLLAVFDADAGVERDHIRTALATLQEEYAQRGLELAEVASGYRVQVTQSMEPWVSRLTQEKPAHYSRALLETLALVAYRQPITRGEIEDIRGVSVSSSIMKTLQEREWVRIVGHRDVPGRPAMYGTTRQFLDYFNLKGLDDLPTLMELRDIDNINVELELSLPGEQAPADESTQRSESEPEADDESGRVVQLSTDNAPDAESSGETLH
jgi:segregation and condensation protein B